MFPVALTLAMSVTCAIMVVGLEAVSSASETAKSKVRHRVKRHLQETLHITGKGSGEATVRNNNAPVKDTVLTVEKDVRSMIKTLDPRSPFVLTG